MPKLERETRFQDLYRDEPEWSSGIAPVPSIGWTKLRPQTVVYLAIALQIRVLTALLACLTCLFVGFGMLVLKASGEIEGLPITIPVMLVTAGIYGMYPACLYSELKAKELEESRAPTILSKLA